VPERIGIKLHDFRNTKTLIKGKKAVNDWHKIRMNNDSSGDVIAKDLA